MINVYFDIFWVNIVILIYNLSHPIFFKEYNKIELIMKIKDGTISGKIAKEVLEEMWQTGSDSQEIIKSKGLEQISDESELESIAQSILDNNPSQVEAFKSGKDKLFGFFVGQVMKETQGKANPGAVNAILKRLLSN